MSAQSVSIYLFASWIPEVCFKFFLSCSPHIIKHLLSYSFKETAREKVITGKYHLLFLYGIHFLLSVTVYDSGIIRSTTTIPTTVPWAFTDDTTSQGRVIFLMDLITLTGCQQMAHESSPYGTGDSAFLRTCSFPLLR